MWGARFPRFCDAPTRSAFYSLGHRNVLGAAQDAASGRVWFTEHGPTGGDELNILEGGANYGWPLVSEGVNYPGESQTGTARSLSSKRPIQSWTPAIGPSGLTIYSGEMFAEWQGSLFLGSLTERHLRRLEVSGESVIHEEVLLKNMDERIRDVRASPDGYIYLAIDRPDGRIVRLARSAEKCVKGSEGLTKSSP